MSTCARCQRPACDLSVRACTAADSGLLPRFGQRGNAPGPAAIGAPPLADRVTCAAGDGRSPSPPASGTFDNDASNREAKMLRSGGDTAAVHDEGLTYVAA